jgi:tRNA(Ile)-lysidine synthase
MALSDFPRHFVLCFPRLVGGRLLMALSGGADSVALLHLIRDPSLRLTLEAAHVHHQVRGAEADRDASFCEDLCRRLEIPFHLVRIDLEESPDEGREGAWRRHRYRELLALAHRRTLDAVATAHHRDDIAEGVVMQLLRGAGPRALAGIATSTEAGVIRPLLPWRRSEIIEWLRERDLAWIEDSSNRDLSHLRNAVRHLVLPQLRDLAPRIDDHVVHLAEAIADDEAFFEAELASRALWIDPWDPNGAIPVERLRALARPLRSRWIQSQTARADIGRVTRRQIELLHRLLDDGDPRSVTLSGRWRLRLARARLWLEPPATPGPYERPLAEGGSIPLPIPGWQVRVGRESEPSSRARWHWRAPDSSRLTVRSPRSGDSVEVEGSPVGISRLIAPVIPRHLRSAWPLFCENARIAWVPGVWTGPSSGDLMVEVLTDG